MKRSQATARIWWNARLDAQKQLPSSEATALSDTERQIQGTANIEITNAWRSYARRAKPLAARLAAVKKALEEIYEPEYERLRELTGRSDVLVHISRTTHLLLLAVLSIGEAAFNLVAFNVFREPAFYTLIMAIAVSLAIPICASVVGLWVRQWPEPKARTAVKIAVVLGILLGALLGVNWLRMAYVEELAPEFAKSHPGLSWIFLAVNLVVLAAATVMSYVAHDPEPGFAEAKYKADRHRATVHELEGELGRLKEELRTAVELAKEKGWQLIGYYRIINRRYRPSPPQYFDDETDANHRPLFAKITDLYQSPVETEELAS